MVDQISRLNLFQRYASRYWKIAIGVFALGVLLYTPMIYIRFMDGISGVHLPPRDCDRLILDEVYCQKFYADDGEIRYSVSSSKLQNCCILNRVNIRNDLLSYRVLACDNFDSSPIECGIPSLAKDPNSDFEIQNRPVMIDTSWHEHQSNFLWKEENFELTLGE